MNTREFAVKVVAAPDLHLNLAMERSLFECPPGGRAPLLADFGGVDSIQAQFARRTAAVGQHPQRVAIGDMGDHTREQLRRLGVDGKKQYCRRDRSGRQGLPPPDQRAWRSGEP